MTDEGGNEYECEPAGGSVKVRMYFNDDQLDKIGADDAGDIKLTHLPLADSVRDDYATTLDATDISLSEIHPENAEADSDEGFIRFQTDSFSVFAISGTSSGSLTLRIKNTMNYWPEGGSFNYQIIENDSVKDTVTLTKDQQTADYQLSYNGAAEHTYTVKQVIPEAAVDNVYNGITFDAEPQTATVSIKDDGDGNLHAYFKDAQVEGVGFEFTNTYAALGKFTPVVTVEFLGEATGTQGHVELELYEESGFPLEVMYVNCASGSAVSAEFSPIEYTLDGIGEHKYHIRQVNADDNIIYDESEHTITVDVTDDGHGTLACQVRVDDSSNYDGVVFKNRIIEYTDINVNLVWKDSVSDTSHPTVTLRLLQNNEEIRNIDLPAGQTSAVFSALPLLDSSGAEYVYDVVEDAVSGYSQSKSVSDGGTIYTFTNEASFEYTIKGSTITLSQTSYTYSGSECKPTVTVEYNGRTLTEGVHYTLEYIKDKVNAGQKYVVVSNTDESDNTDRVMHYYTINARSIAGAAITFTKGNSVDYTGSTVTNAIKSVKLGGRMLDIGTDWEIVDSTKLSGKKAGSYTVKIQGLGNYTGTASSKWTITEEDEDDDSSTDSSSDDDTTSDTSPAASSSPRTDAVASTPRTWDGGSGASTAKAAVSDNNTASAAGSSKKTSKTSSKKSTSSNSAGSGAGSVSSDSPAGRRGVSANNTGSGSGGKKNRGKDDADAGQSRYASEDGVIENKFEPAKGYENDSQINAAVEDIDAVGEAVMAGDFRDAVENGSEIEIWIDVKPAEAQISEEEKGIAEKYITDISDRVEGLCIGRYLNVKVYFQVDKGGWQDVKETNAPVAIDFSVPESLKNLSNRYYVLCIHDGVAELLSDVNEDPDMITVMTQWLQATYVLLYQDMDAGVAGEIFAPVVTDDTAYSGSTEVNNLDDGKSRPGVLAASWLITSGATLAAYGGYEYMKNREAFMIMLQSLPHLGHR